MSGLLFALKVIGVLIGVVFGIFILMLLLTAIIVVIEEGIRLIKEKGGKK